MSRTFYFGNVTKRKNSTLQGTITNTFSVLFKNPCSLDNPTLTLKYSGDFDYNVAKYVTSDTPPKTYYYFVVDKKALHNDMWEVSLELDVLATYKTEILGSTAYVLYDSVANTELVDNRLPMKTTGTVLARMTTCPFVPDGGCYILSLTGSNNTTGIYKTDSVGLAALVDDLQHIKDNMFDFSHLTPPSWPSAPTIGDGVEAFLDYIADCLGWVGDWIDYAIQAAVHPIAQFMGSGNIPENIRECRFIPFDVGTTGGAQLIYLGSFETQVSLAKLTTKTVHRTVSVSIPWQVNDYRRRSPYTELYLYLPYIGMTRLSTENLIGINSLTVAYTLGMYDGNMIVTVTGGSEVIGQYSCNVAASVPVGFSNINIPKAAQSLIAGVAAAYAGTPAAAGMAALNFADSVTPNYSCIGGLDGIAGTATNQNITCYSIFHDTIVPPNSQIATIGAPTMSPKALSGLTGYCQCLDAHVALDADAPIMDKVDSYLNSGFFIE